MHIGISIDLLKIHLSNFWIHICNDIQKYDTISNKMFLTLAFVDDANLVFRRLMSLMVALHKIELFRDVSGFTLNMSKTKGVFYNKKNIICQNALPNICWVKNIEVCPSSPSIFPFLAHIVRRNFSISLFIYYNTL